MAKYFPKLTQATVYIQTDDKGGGFECPMLPISAMNDIDQLSKDLAEAAKKQDVAAIGDIRKKMVKIAQTVIPEQYHSNIFRLSVDKCVELLAYLMYGDPDGNDKAPAPEKN